MTADHKFCISTRRSAFQRESEREGISPFEKLSLRFAAAVTGGSCYVQLQNPDGQRTSYFYDGAGSKKTKMLQALGVVVATQAWVFLISPALEIPLTLMHAFAVVGANFGLTSTSRGVVVRKRKPAITYETAMVSISRERYLELREELNTLAKKPRHGIYSLPFNNCARFAVNFARSHGFDIPKPLFCTPGTVSQTMHQMRDRLAPSPAAALELTG